MRKHDVRKWLHAILDLLPVILIPVFMIYSHRHDVTENVQINYKYQSNEVNTLDNLVVDNIYYIDEVILSSDAQQFYFNVIDLKQISFDTNTWSFIDLGTNNYNSTNIYLNGNIVQISVNNNGLNSVLEYDLNDSDMTLTDLIFSCDSNENLNQFKSLYLAFGNLPQYTDYNVIESVDTTNSNVLDSFMNNFNNTIQTHFNMGNVFNLGDVYQWFNTNIFNGNAPTIIYSIYNIVLYELVMDLLFLLYALFMWFIDMIEKLMEKPLNSVR